MAYSKIFKEAVRTSYTRDMLNLANCASRHRVPVATVSSWKKKDQGTELDWDVARSARTLGDSALEDLMPELVRDFSELYRTVMTDILKNKDINTVDKVKLLSQLSDAFVKFTGAATRGAPSLHKLTVKLETIAEFVEFVQRQFPQVAPALLEALEAFGNEVQRKHG